MNIDKLDALYKLYRFQKLPISNEKFRVYSYTSKYFSNADVIVLDNTLQNHELVSTSEQVESLGFSVKIRNYKTIEEAEESLFDGFFDNLCPGDRCLRLGDGREQRAAENKDHRKSSNCTVHGYTTG